MQQRLQPEDNLSVSDTMVHNNELQIARFTQALVECIFAAHSNAHIHENKVLIFEACVSIDAFKFDLS